MVLLNVDFKQVQLNDKFAAHLPLLPNLGLEILQKSRQSEGFI